MYIFIFTLWIFFFLHYRTTDCNLIKKFEGLMLTSYIIFDIGLVVQSKMLYLITILRSAV